MPVQDNKNMTTEKLQNDIDGAVPFVLCAPEDGENPQETPMRKSFPLRPRNCTHGFDEDGTISPDFCFSLVNLSSRAHKDLCKPLNPRTLSLSHIRGGMALPCLPLLSENDDFFEGATQAHACNDELFITPKVLSKEVSLSFCAKEMKNSEEGLRQKLHHEFFSEEKVLSKRRLEMHIGKKLMEFESPFASPTRERITHIQMKKGAWPNGETRIPRILLLPTL